MLEVRPIEFLLRSLPEGFIVVLAIYIFSKVDINKKKYLSTSVVFSIITFTVRLLPINYGVHMVLSVLFLLFIIVSYNKIDAVSAIKSIIFIYLIQFISEAINVLILNFMNVDLDTQFKNPIYKSIIGIPSLIITGVIILIIYIFNNKKRKH
ncbi:hypothetical protein [uncultured Clostridium sp.]|uniref:hypothetical protein n=1 Tax=uncultured Clostridium sp. TaxID=59620 RepID=UPI0025F09E97|nr:hypothetical protein [uncultured Clostridium sp.]